MHDDEMIDHYCFDSALDPERMYQALAEVGLQPEFSGGGWFGWARRLTDHEVELCERAEAICA